MPTLTLQPDGTAGIDCGVVEDFPDGSGPTATAFDIRTHTTAVRRVALLKFDLSSIPANAIVLSATFSIWFSGPFLNVDGDSTYAIYRILAANSGWTEACTWNYALPSTIRWAGDTGANGGVDAGCSVPGTDYSSTAFGTTVVPDAEAVDTQHDITMNVAEVQAMLAANHGIYMRKTGPNSTEVNAFKSSDHATSGHRPKLVIVYTMPVPVKMSSYRRRRVN